MVIYEFDLTVVSPMFLNGADTKMPELRAASVRGQLRYWLRAYLGARTSDLKEIWDEESAVFGSTGQGSTVSMRVFGSPQQNTRVDWYPNLSSPNDLKDVILSVLPQTTVTQTDLPDFPILHPNHS